MKKLAVLSAVAALAAVTGCSTIVEGTSQTLSFNTDPSGANCSLERNGITIGKVVTPGAVRIDRTKHGINVTCLLEGYDNGTAYLKSHASAATFGNIIAGGGIGWAIDSAAGADNKYDEVTYITLKRKVAAQ
jgi:hypothetical protein